MERITEKTLRAVVDRINRILGTPTEAYTRQPDGSLKANIGNVHLDCAYGGYGLCQMSNEGGGVTQPIGGGFYTKRQLYDLLHAYIRGLETKRGAA